VFDEGSGVADDGHPFFTGVTGHFPGHSARRAQLIVIHSFILPGADAGEAHRM
jgi:hypothetical protein